MMKVIEYRITVHGDEQYKVSQYPQVTYVEWKDSNGGLYSLPYTNKDVIQFLKEGRWKKVPSKREIEKNHKKAPNLFSLDNL